MSTDQAVLDRWNACGWYRLTGLEVLQADHQNKTDVGANTAREWFDRRDVDAGIGPLAPQGADVCAGEPHRQEQ